MTDNFKKISVHRFGPADLISRLKKVKWVPCIPNGKTFPGLLLGGYSLNDPGDLLSGKYRVTLENLSIGKNCAVIGFGYANIVMAIQITGHIIVDGEPLRNNYIKHYCRFRLTVDKLR